jgi:DNA-binding LytR/AlgR family response regulator
MKQNSENSSDSTRSGGLRLRRSHHAFCPLCAKQVELMSIDGAAELFKTDLQDIEFLASHGSLHQIHNRRGRIMICASSLFDCFEARRTRLLDSGILKVSADKRSA